MEELKQRLFSKAVEIKRYGDRITQYTQNSMFADEQKRLFQQLKGELVGEV